jgi:hypothetical protein
MDPVTQHGMCAPIRYSEGELTPVRDPLAGAKLGIALSMTMLVICTSLLVAMTGHAEEVAIGWVLGGLAAAMVAGARVIVDARENARAFNEAVRAAQEAEAARIREMNIRTAPARRQAVAQRPAAATVQRVTLTAQERAALVDEVVDAVDRKMVARSFFAKTKTDVQAKNWRAE